MLGLGVRLATTTAVQSAALFSALLTVAADGAVSSLASTGVGKVRGGSGAV